MHTEPEPEQGHQEVDRLRLLVEASGTLLGTLEIDEVLPRVVELAGRVLAADAYSVWRFDQATGQWRIQIVEGLSEDYQQAAMEGIRGNTSAVSLDAPIVAEDIEQTDWLTDRHREAHLREGHRAMVAIPLRHRGHVIGTLVFYYRRPRTFDDTDLRAASALGNLAAAAIGTADLYRLQREAREQLAVLADASTVLASSLDYETTLANVAALIVPDFADWCAVDLVDEDTGEIRRIVVLHRDPEKAEWAERSKRVHAPDRAEREGTARAVRTGEPLLYPVITDEFLAETAYTEGQLDVLRNLGMRSAMVVPLITRGRTIGALMFVAGDPLRTYAEDDLEFAKHLARRAAAAVDNARLYREAERRAQASRALAFVGDGVALVDREGIVRLWNPAAAQITGIAEELVVGRGLPAGMETWEGVAERAQPPSAPGSHRTRLETLPIELGGKELWLSVSAVAFEGGTVFAFRDVTEERELERMKSEFVATVSHELRTPLAAIYGASLTLQRSDFDVEPHRETLLDVISSEADRLARTVNDVLWASRLEGDSMRVAIEPFESRELLHDVADAARAYLPETIALEVEDGLGTPPVVADREKLRQVLTNLVDNAIKYSPDGGRISLSLEPVDGRVRVRVRDEGLGIPRAERERVFEKFYRLDPNLTRGVGGTGLGLYICRELVRRMDGSVWIEDGGARGSTFVVELPTA